MNTDDKRTRVDNEDDPALLARTLQALAPWAVSAAAHEASVQALRKVERGAAKFTPASIPASALPAGVSIELGKYVPHYDSELAKIRAGADATLSQIAHEAGHAKMVGTPKTAPVRHALGRATYEPGARIMGSRAANVLSPILYSQFFSDLVTPEKSDSMVYKAIDGLQRHSGLVIGSLMAGPLLHELGATIIGARLAKQYAGQAYSTTLKELGPAFGTYAASALPHIYLSQVAEKRYRETHPEPVKEDIKTAGASRILVLYADDIADLALQGYRLRHVLPFNHEQHSDIPRPVEVKPPEPKIAMVAELAAGLTGATLGGATGAWIGGKGRRLPGTLIGSAIGAGMGIAAMPKIPTYEPQDTP